MSLDGCKGFVPSAGFGTRLKPLTDSTPKPALPFFGQPSLYLVLQKLATAGIDQIAINSHFQADKIQELVDQFPLKAKITVSFEPEILGTGGAHIPLLNWRENMNLMIYNPDIISDLDIGSFYDFHVRSAAYASMALLPYSRLGTPAVLTRGDDIVSFGGKISKEKDGLQKNYGTAIYILSPQFLAEFLPKEKKFFSIIDCFEAAIAKRRPIKAFFHRGKWFDFGEHLFGYWNTHAMLLKAFDSPANAAWLGLDKLMQAQNKDYFFSKFQQPREATLLRRLVHCEGPVFISGFDQGMISLGKNVRLGPNTCIFDAATIGDGAQISNSLVADGKILAGERINNMIIYANHRLPIQEPV